MITNEQLTKRVNELALEKWGVRFSLPCEIVKNLNANGMFSAEFDGYGKIKPIGMKISYNLMQYYPKDIIDGVILHELCHWILLLQGKPNGDEDIEFFIEMEKVGGLFTLEISIRNLRIISKARRCKYKCLKNQICIGYM